MTLERCHGTYVDSGTDSDVVACDLCGHENPQCYGGERCEAMHPVAEEASA